MRLTFHTHTLRERRIGSEGYGLVIREWMVPLDMRYPNAGTGGIEIEALHCGAVDSTTQLSEQDARELRDFLNELIGGES